MSSNLEEKLVRQPNLKNAETIQKMSSGEPWYGSKLSGAESVQVRESEYPQYYYCNVLQCNMHT